MNLVHVIPLSRGVFKDELSYFTSRAVLPGAIVSVPLRSKKISALVVSSENVSDAKATIKASPYAMKKIDDFKSKEFFLPEFIKASREAAKYFVTTPGDIIQTFTPREILRNPSTVRESSHEYARDTARDNPQFKKERFVLQAPLEERMSLYKSLIREEFARQTSVFFCLPTIQDIEVVVESLERGISEYTFVFHSGISPKKLLEMWNKVIAQKHPVLIVATATFLSIPRRDVGTIILDHENSRNYRTFSRPFVDLRTFAQIYAEKTQARLILGDTILRPETLWQKEEGFLHEFAPTKFRSISSAEHSIVDMRNSKKDTLHRSWNAVSDELRTLITKTVEEHKRIFILVGRKGLSPITVCSDCGAIHMCPKCSSPLVLHKNRETSRNEYICHKCGMVSSADVRCKQCDSWRLTPLGTGIDKVEDEIREAFPKVPIMRIDSDATKSQKKILDVKKEFYATPGAILIGTGMALPYLTQEIPHTAIVGIDALFTIPDFRINDKIMNLFLELRGKTKSRFLVQTRNPEARIFGHLVRGNLLDFYRDEIEERKIFGYPPFQQLIKIVWSGKKAHAKEEIEKLSSLLKGYEHMAFPAFIQELKGLYRMNTLIKMEPGAWVDEKLFQILKALPPSFVIHVDPEDIL